MSQDRIRRALETRLATFAAAERLPVAFQGATFKPPAGLYLRAWLLPNSTISETLGREHRRYIGIWQVSIFAPAGEGAGRSEALALRLANAYDPSLPLESGGLLLWLTEPMTLLPAISDAERIVSPCSIPYRADEAAQPASLSAQ